MGSFPATQLDAKASPPTMTTSAGNSVDVRLFGAKADAVTDDTPAFQHALNACGVAGGTVFVPSGRYLLSGTLDVPEGVTLQGSFQASPRPFRFDHNLAAEKGTILLSTFGKNQPEGTPFITLNTASTLSGLVIFYPEQTVDITPYPWCVRGRGDNCTVKDTMLVNPYRGVDLGTFPCARHTIRGLYGQPLKTGIWIDQCRDVGRIEDVHFWPFWTDDPKVWAWTGQNGTAYLIFKTDWEEMFNCFDIFYSVGYEFDSGKEGPGNVLLTNCGSDTGPVAVRVNSGQLNSGVSFVNGQFSGTVEVGPENTGPVKFTACGFMGVPSYTDEHARIRGFGQTSFTSCHFVGGSQLHKGSFAIDAFTGGLSVIGCEFMDTGTSLNHIRLGEGVRTAVISGNTFRSPIKIASKSHGQVAIIGNVSAMP